MNELLNLQWARDRVASEIDAQVAAFERALSNVWRQLDRSLSRLVIQASAGSPTAIIRAARAGRLQQEIAAALSEAGWDDLVNHSTDAALTPLVADVNAVRLAAEVGAFGSGDALKIEALKVLAGSDLLGAGEGIARELWQATVQGVFSSRAPTRILDDLAQALDESLPRVRTLYDTSITIFARQVEALGVPAEPDRPFVYTGPNDDKVRPFCKVHLGRVYTKNTIDTLDNGQLPNVFLTGGGYNCRHGWTAVSKFSDLAKLANTGERVPAFSRGIGVGGSRAA